MPVKIVKDKGGATSTAEGTIRSHDLQTMLSEYQNHVALTAIPPRNAIIKRNSFYFTKAQVLALFDQYSANADADTIEVAIAVQVPDSITHCEKMDQSINNTDCLAVIISMTNQVTREPLNNANDYVLINGYHPTQINKYRLAQKQTEIAMCCPGSKPPPPPTL